MFPRPVLTTVSTADNQIGLKSVIKEEGVWRIRKPEKVPIVEVFRVEEAGTGDILSQRFRDWRSKEPTQDQS